MFISLLSIPPASPCLANRNHHILYLFLSSILPSGYYPISSLSLPTPSLLPTPLPPSPLPLLPPITLCSPSSCLPRLIRRRAYGPAATRRHSPCSSTQAVVGGAGVAGVHTGAGSSRPSLWGSLVLSPCLQAALCCGDGQRKKDISLLLSSDPMCSAPLAIRVSPLFLPFPLHSPYQPSFSLLNLSLSLSLSLPPSPASSSHQRRLPPLPPLSLPHLLSGRPRAHLVRGHGQSAVLGGHAAHPHSRPLHAHGTGEATPIHALMHRRVYHTSLPPVQGGPPRYALVATRIPVP